jgi:hypothetical protein
MAQGHVMTARGEVLNLDGLIAKANAKMVKMPASEIKKKKISKRKPLNVRGYSPVSGEAKVPQMPVNVRQEIDNRERQRIETVRAQQHREMASSYNDKGTAVSMADVTGLKMEVTEAAIFREKARKQAGIVAPEASSEALSEILQELASDNRHSSRMDSYVEKNPSEGIEE